MSSLELSIKMQHKAEIEPNRLYSQTQIKKRYLPTTKQSISKKGTI